MKRWYLELEVQGFNMDDDTMLDVFFTGLEFDAGIGSVDGVVTIDAVVEVEGEGESLESVIQRVKDHFLAKFPDMKFGKELHEELFHFDTEPLIDGEC